LRLYGLSYGFVDMLVIKAITDDHQSDSSFREIVRKNGMIEFQNGMLVDICLFVAS